MTWIKICGITNLEDALTAVDAGADALGFVFYEKSPRKIDPEAAREIVRQLPDEIETIGVFVDEPVERVFKISERVDLKGVQLHGGQNRKTARELAEEFEGKRRIYGVLPMNRLPLPESGEHVGWDPFNLDALTPESAEIFANVSNDAYARAGESGHAIPKYQSGVFSALVLDSGAAAGEGGTGRTFDWDRARPFVDAVGSLMNIVIAGGLDPANVRGMIRTLHPWGVDVASGVEEKPGKKSATKVQAFVSAVRAAEIVLGDGNR